MNTSTLKSYAPEARQAFITAVSAQASRLGISATEIQPAQAQGDVLLIAGQAFSIAINESRNKLVERVRAHGFDSTMDAVAYTWFNRFAAIRYMEIHGYLDHGYRVLSHPEGHGRPEILDHAADVDLPGLDRAKAIELKLDGTKDEELYRLLLKAQCNALHQAMPFLFEPIGGADELLLPANLLHTDSLIRQLVESIDEALWQDIEIIGWLYQFYISEKKDEVIGKVVKSEDIPAATQLFTPNWIVKYMVQNSLGAQWLATYPNSPLKGQMEYYIEPAEQTDEVNAQLAAITPKALNPEALTLIDPASGSGHILVEAYELFKTIYLERGYRQRDVPQLILEKNLFGLDIDERAAQLTGFALMMKGRADDRRLFERGVKLNVMALVDSAGFDAEGLAKGVELLDYDLRPGDLTELKQLFEHATTFGSLIQVPEGLAEKLPALKQLSEATSQDLFVSEALKRLGPLVQQAEFLAAEYDVAVANPPYMGRKYLNPIVKRFLQDHYKDYDKDLFAAFIYRNLSLTKLTGYNAYVAPYVWMFLGSFEALRSKILDNYSIGSLVKPSYTSFFESAIVSLVTFVIEKRTRDFRGTFFDLGYLGSAESQPIKLRRGIQESTCDYKYSAVSSDFKKIPSSPVAYWVTNKVRDIFFKSDCLDNVAVIKQGLATCNNNLFLRHWYEPSQSNVNFAAESHDLADASGAKWFPYNKGGGYRKWYGNNLWVVNWKSRGCDIHRYSELPMNYSGAPVRAKSYYFQHGITYSLISSFGFSARFVPSGFIFDVGGSMVFPSIDLEKLQGYLASNLAEEFIRILNPTVNYQVGDVARLPVLISGFASLKHDLKKPIELTKSDEDSFEISWDFQSLPILTASSDSSPTLESSYTAWTTQNKGTIAEMKRLEEENNRLFIDAYGLQGELTPDVPIEQITLTVNPAYRYGGKLTVEEQWTRFRQDTMEELVSYAIGCMMGRYSLDAPGLIYAHSGNEGFDPSQYTTFPADDDGIVPLTDTEWFEDDACNRVIEFLSKAWDESHLEANLTFLAENLAPKKSESSRDTLRRYLNDKFFKDHLQGYKNRPIYWLFSSGKQKAFQCLVYLHRYNEGTLSRMRAEYVIPLQGKMAVRLEQLQGDIAAATSTAQSKRLTKESEKLAKQQAELLKFDEKLRHYADMRIGLDLDDGVKVNYGQFGDLLADVKAIHGKKV